MNSAASRWHVTVIHIVIFALTPLMVWAAWPAHANEKASIRIHHSKTCWRISPLRLNSAMYFVSIGPVSKLAPLDEDAIGKAVDGYLVANEDEDKVLIYRADPAPVCNEDQPTCIQGAWLTFLEANNLLH